MEEQSKPMEINPFTTMEFENKKLFWKKFNVVSNIVLIVWLLIIGGYVMYKVVPEIENFKTLNKDVCRLCEQKTGGVCKKETYIGIESNESDNIYNFKLN